MLKRANEKPSEYAGKLKPRAYQYEALGRLENQPAFALLMAMRTGKTKVALDDFGRLELAGRCDDLLVIAPGGVYESWLPACAEHLSDDLFHRAFIHVWKGGKGKKELDQLKALLAYPGPRIFMINIEALGRVKRAETLVNTFLASNRRCMCVVDESTIIKNDSMQTRMVLNLKSRFAYRRILSGLPTPQSPLDLYYQFAFLDEKILGFRSFYAFRQRFCVLQQVQFASRGKPVTLVVKHKDPEELQARIAPFSFRKRLEDCYDLPAKMYVRRNVPLTDEQERIYQNLKLFATAELEQAEHVTAVNVISQIMKLHQVLLGHVKNEAGEEKTIPEHRTEELMKLLADYDGKAIIWCSYDFDIRKVSKAIVEEYGHEALANFWGGNRTTREHDELRFKTDPRCRFMVATSAAGGRGRTWDVADMLVYYSNTDNLEHRMQSEERAESVGRSHSTLIVDLGVPGTVEDKIIQSMREKLNMSTIINGDNYRQWLV